MKRFLTLIAISAAAACAQTTAQSTPVPVPDKTGPDKTTYFTSNLASNSIARTLPGAPPTLKPQVQFFITGPSTTDRYTVIVFYGDNQSASQDCRYGANSGIPNLTLCIVNVDALVITKTTVQVFSKTEEVTVEGR